MKKTAALLLSLAFMASPAYAYDIQTDISAFEFEVSLQSDETTDRPTVQMLDAEKTKVIYMGEGISRENADDTYTFEFDKFSVPKNLPTGDYIIRVGGKGILTKEAPISFINNNDKASALNELNVAADKGGVLLKRFTELGIDISGYAALSSEWRGVVNKEIAKHNLSNDGSPEQVSEKYDLFMGAYTLGMETAVIAGSEDSKAVRAMIDSSEKLGLDKDGYYKKLTDKNSVAGILTKKKFTPQITREELVKEFDGAVLVAVINQLDWGSAKAAAEYYSEKGVVDIDFSDFKNLSGVKQGNVFKDLKNARITDYKDVSAQFDLLVDKYKNTPSSGSSGGGGGGTGGGSHGGAGFTAPVYTPNIIPTPAPQPENTQKPPAVSEFTDMDNYGWAKTAVSELLKRGVVAGDGSGKFNPQDLVTREEFAKIMVMAFNLYQSGAAADFEDVPHDAWFYGYVASAKKNGIVQGISETEFGAGRAITRQDMAVMLKRVYDMAECKAGGNGAEFKDYAQIADYAKEAVSVLSGAGVINGDGEGAFLPLDPVTRAQSAQAVYKLLRIVESE